MSDSNDLRTRIAAVQRQHRLGRSVVPGHDPGYICECGWRSAEPDCTWTDHPEHVADAVIRELRLHVVTVGDFQTVIKGSYPKPLEES